MALGTPLRSIALNWHFSRREAGSGLVEARRWGNVGYSGALWGLEHSGRRLRTGEWEVSAGVLGHSYATPRREGPAVPARQIPRGTGRRTGDHQGPGALPLRLPGPGVRPDHRGLAHRAGDREERAGLQPRFLRQCV